MDHSWKEVLTDEFDNDYIVELGQFILQERERGKIIYPNDEDIFAAFHFTSFDQIKVVIVGQDPYHQPNQAHGLSFSVRSGVELPRSLVNIFTEIQNDIGGNFPQGKGCLIPWAQQGVLLLNRVLTVEKGRAGSHHGRGWEEFTDRIIEEINKQRENVVFLLWGTQAQKRWIVEIDRRRHLVLSTAHPSPLSAHRGFFGCRHFSRTNRYLIEHGKSPIDWLDVE